MFTPTIRAIIVGIDEYADTRYRERARLQCACADAREIAGVVHRSNALRVDEAHCYVLTNEQATQDVVLRGLHQVFPSNLNFDHQTIALFYFAGHGVKHPIDDKIILCCRDADFANPYRGGITLNQIYDLLVQSSAGCSIAIIDACFSGGISDIKRIEHVSPVDQARRAFQALQGPDDKTIAIFASCRENQVAREDVKKGHGIYTYEFLRGWRDGEALDREGAVSISSLIDYLSIRFKNDKQAPKPLFSGSRRVVLQQGDPPAPGAQRQVLEPLEPPSHNKMSFVGGRITLPVQELVADVQEPKRLKRLAIPVLITMAVLLTCGLSIKLVQPLQQGVLYLVFGLGIMLALASFGIHRVVGFLLAPVQLVLLVGFANHYFQWGSSVPVLNFLGDLAWLFWVLFVIEMIFVVTTAFDVMTQ